MTPELYLPCINCGSWRRQHVGKEKKCLFGATHFEPTPSELLTVKQIRAVQERADTLRSTLQTRLEEEVQRTEEAIDRITTLAQMGCKHVDEQGVSTIELITNFGEEGKRHYECSICDEDWYGDHP